MCFNILMNNEPSAPSSCCEFSWKGKKKKQCALGRVTQYHCSPASKWLADSQSVQEMSSFSLYQPAGQLAAACFIVLCWFYDHCRHSKSEANLKVWTFNANKIYEANFSKTVDSRQIEWFWNLWFFLLVGNNQCNSYRQGKQI